VSPEPEILIGYKRVEGQSQKGDNIWDGERFRKVRKGYPFAGDSGAFIIRKCEVVQTEIAETVQPETEVEF
jgi:hypothetical protein